MAQKTEAYLEVSYPGQRSYYIDEVKEFSYSSDVLAVGDPCTFTVVADDEGEMLRKLRLGSRLKLKMRNPSVRGGFWTPKHSGVIVSTDADLENGTIKVTSADLGWHLQNCHAPLWKRLRGLTLAQICDPNAKKALIDQTFGLKGVRAGFDANALNRRIREGRAAIAAQVGKVLDPVNVIQVEPGESYYDVITKYAQRQNLLVNVGVDDQLQIWNPDYDRAPAFRLFARCGDGNVKSARRHDDASTRYTEVICVGEVINLQVQFNDPNNPNASKRRGKYKAAEDPAAPGLPAPLPFTHRHTFGDGEMLSSKMAAAQAEWRWKRGLFDSHYLEITVPDHFQGTEWWESDEMVSVEIPGLDAVGNYYLASVRCDSTVAEGDTSTLVLRWPHLLSASFGDWRSPPNVKSPAAKAALKKGKGSGQ